MLNPRTEDIDRQIAQFHRAVKTVSDDGTPLSEGHKSLQAWYCHLVKQTEVRRYLESEDYDGLCECIHNQLYILERPVRKADFSEVFKSCHGYMTYLEKKSHDLLSIQHNDHELQNCEQLKCGKEEDYFFFLPKKEKFNYLTLGISATYKFYFKMEHWGHVANLLKNIILDEAFSNKIAQAKMISIYNYSKYALPAVIYLYGICDRDDINAYLADHLNGISIDCPVPGGAKQGEHFHYTEHQPDNDGCQPLSRARMLASSLQTNFYHASLSPAAAISRVARMQGYLSYEPEKLHPPLPSFDCLLTHIEQSEENEPLPSTDIAVLRGKMIRILASLYDLTELKSTGPWLINYKQFEKYSLKQIVQNEADMMERVSVSLQFRQNKLLDCLTRFYFCVEHCSSMIKEINICLRDPTDKKFSKEPFLVIYKMNDDMDFELLGRLKNAFNSEILQNHYLAGLCCEQDGIYTGTSYSTCALPSLSEQIEESVIAQFHKKREAGCTVSSAILLREILFLSGRHGHDPSLVR